MSTAIIPLNELLPTLATEARRRKLLLSFLFAAIALAALAAGMLWPEKYNASTTILVQESNIVTGLMEGRAVATGVANRAAIAREVIFSRKVMDDILAAGGWMSAQPPPTPLQQDQIIERIESRTRIESPRDNLIQIAYSDSSPERAYHVTEHFARMFIQESLAAKERESRDAFEFISSQVAAYHKKLEDAENKLKAYRDQNPDARPGSETDTNTRISQLRVQIEQSRMEMMEQQSKEAAIRSQLGGESEINVVQTRSGQIEAQLATLQSELDRLLLTYTDQYPDVVRIRHQIQELKQALAKADSAQERSTGTSTALGATVQYSPVYQELKLKLGEARRNAAAAAARMKFSENQLNQELERSKRVANTANAEAELTRDYEVNRDIYQDLLKRRENARVSMNLDQEQRGLTFRIQEPAIMPLQPSGLRMVHFVAAGLLLGLAVPFSLLFGYARFDPRVHSAAQIERMAGVPVLASIPVYDTPRERRRERRQYLLVALIVLATAAAYVSLYLLRTRMHP
ncbi:XrtA system polysaccharide chain length determinant [Dokdonella sp.]|uniref:XrtA system polysaccharide chain length determinant n=1 Tax=Dokdonella sp. TaxID=2291710 RepID=UPI0031C915A4|nr:hypothetical protein [Dokdonella sp.]